MSGFSGIAVPQARHLAGLCRAWDGNVDAILATVSAAEQLADLPTGVHGPLRQVGDDGQALARAITQATDELVGFRITLPNHIRQLELTAQRDGWSSAGPPASHRTDADHSNLLGDDAGPLGQIAELQRKLADFDGSDNDPRIDAWARELQDFVAATGATGSTGLALSRALLGGDEVVATYAAVAGSVPFEDPIGDQVLFALRTWLDANNVDALDHATLDALRTDPNTPAPLRAAADEFAAHHFPMMLGVPDSTATESVPMWEDGPPLRDLDGRDVWIDPNGGRNYYDIDIGLIDDFLAENQRLRSSVEASAPFRWAGDHQAAFERLALVHDRGAAARFVNRLPATFDDLTGLSTGIALGDVSSSAWERHARTLIDGSESLTDRVALASRLPETEAADRNKLTTWLYAEMADQMNRVLNAGLANPDDPTTPGHTGLNWAHFGASASSGVRPVIDRSQDLLGPMTVNDATAQQAADGNQWIFGTIGPAFAEFIERFDDTDATPATLDAYLEARTAIGTPVFVDGTSELRDGMVFYAAAMEATDPVERQRLLFLGNGLLGTFEQGGIDPYVDDILDLSFRDDGIMALGQAVTVFLGGDQEIATAMSARVQVGLDGEIFDLTRDIPRMRLANNLIDDLDLVDDLDATVAITSPIDVGDFTVSLTGLRADVVAEPLHGVANPLPGSPRDPFPASSADWRDIGGNEVLHSMAGPIAESSTGTGDAIEGSGVINWAHDESRMFYIANWFREQHTDPVIMQSIHDFTPDVQVPWLHR